jgi:hypothetical protein
MIRTMIIGIFLDKAEVPLSNIEKWDKPSTRIPT